MHPDRSSNCARQKCCSKLVRHCAASTCDEQVAWSVSPAPPEQPGVPQPGTDEAQRSSAPGAQGASNDETRPPSPLSSLSSLAHSDGRPKTLHGAASQDSQQHSGSAGGAASRGGFQVYGSDAYASAPALSAETSGHLDLLGAIGAGRRGSQPPPDLQESGDEASVTGPEPDSQRTGNAVCARAEPRAADAADGEAAAVDSGAGNHATSHGEAAQVAPTSPALSAGRHALDQLLSLHDSDDEHLSVATGGYKSAGAHAAAAQSAGASAFGTPAAPGAASQSVAPSDAPKTNDAEEVDTESPVISASLGSDLST